jgi:hypothetical protein
MMTNSSRWNRRMKYKVKRIRSTNHTSSPELYLPITTTELNQ